MSCLRHDTPDNSILRSTVFAGESSSATEKYSKIGKEALGILHGLEKFHHSFFAREESIINSHKPLEAIFKKDVATVAEIAMHTT